MLLSLNSFLLNIAASFSKSACISCSSTILQAYCAGAMEGPDEAVTGVDSG